MGDAHSLPFKSTFNRAVKVQAVHEQLAYDAGHCCCATPIVSER